MQALMCLYVDHGHQNVYVLLVPNEILHKRESQELYV